jgi:uncharacterized protein
MNQFIRDLKKQKQVIGMVHVKALPGSPLHELSIKEITLQAIKEAKIYMEAGVDAIMLENMHDIPYLNNKIGPEITSAMSVIGSAVKDTIDIPCGMQILAGANKQALAVANSCGFDFIRVENFAYAHVADEGIMESCAGELLRYRRYINAEHVAIFTDVKKKHSSHAITSDITLEETIKTNQFFLSDGIIITGKTTGEEPELPDLSITQNATDLPILIGSGITKKNISSFWNMADGFIVGSYFKEKGIWSGELSLERIQSFIEYVTTLRNG